MSTALMAGTAAGQAAGAAEWRNRQPGMAYRRLGRTGLMISEVVAGGNEVRENNHEHILLALDLGVNYLDTAPAYGSGAGERAYGRIIKSRGRDRFFLATKVTPWDQNRSRTYREIFDSQTPAEQKKLLAAAEEEIARRQALDPDYFGDYFPGQRREIEAAALANVVARKYGRQIEREKNFKQIILDSLNQSLERLGTDHVDVLLCPHGANTPVELLDYPDTFEAFEILKRQGKARFLGVSAHTDPAGILEAAVASKVYSMAMVAYNIVNRRFVEQALERARRHDLGVIAMKVARPVYNGRGKPDDPRRVKLIHDAVPGPLKVPQKAYLWALGNPNLAAVNADMTTAEQVREDVSLAGKRPPRVTPR